MNLKDPKEIALDYLKAFENKEREETRNFLADQGSFIGPLNSFTEADEFVKGADVFMKIAQKFEIKKVLAEGNDVCVFYNYVTIVPSIPSIPMAEWFKIESGKIKFLQLHFNPISIVKAMESGELDKVLKSIK